MKLLVRVFLYVLALGFSISSWATEYRKFTHLTGDFVFWYPIAWKLTPGMQTVNFVHPDGKEILVRVGGFPLGRDDPGSAEEYVAKIIAGMGLYGRHLSLQDAIQVSGRAATKLEFTEKHGSWGQASGIEVVVANGAQYYVISLYGKVSDVAIIRPEFDRIVSSLRLGQERKLLMEWRGEYDGPEIAARMAARTPGELQGMIQTFGVSVEKLIPKGGLDFNKYMLTGISLGQKPTGGYSVSIVDFHEKGGTLYIRYLEQSPKPNSMATQALTTPYHLKILPASKANKVSFEKTGEPEISSER